MPIQTHGLTKEQINARSEELMQEFFRLFQELTKADPDRTDLNIVFQGWAIQKIAFLQLAILELESDLNRGARSQAQRRYRQ